MADIGDWRPIKGTHAIHAASVGVAFGQPINAKPWQRVEKALTERAQARGLDVKQPIQVLTFGIPQIGAALDTNAGGVEFIKRSAAPEAVAQKLQVFRDRITYEDLEYTRWAPMLKQASGFFDAVLAEYLAVVELKEISASYTDIFRSSAANPDCTQIISPNSPCVATQAYSADRPWHTHIGWFEYPSPFCRRLHQVNIEVADAVFPDGKFRVAQITTNVVDQFNQADLDPVPEDEQSAVALAKRHQSAHERLKQLLALVLTAEAAQAISMEA